MYKSGRDISTKYAYSYTLLNKQTNMEALKYNKSLIMEGETEEEYLIE